MNKNYKSKVNKNLRHIFSAVCLLVFILTATVFAQTPPLRANGKIAFTSDRDGNQEIYVMNNDGTGQVRLTNNPGADSFPAFSPDGRKIAFISQNTSPTFGSNIKIMNADGTNQIQLTPITYFNSPYPWHEKKSLDWSPDGSKIAFDESGEIFTVNVDGSNRTNLTNHPARDIEPSWSPDGSRIVFVSSRIFYWTMHTMNADGSDVRALPSAGELWDMSPDWSPTGNKIAFVVHSEENLPILYIANADGTNRQPFDGCGAGGCPTHRNKPKWSPDAMKIVFHIWDFFSNDAEIYVKNVNGGGLIRLTNTNGRNFQPSWQPLAPATTFADFDGDGKADVSVFRPSNGTWYLNQSTNGLSATQFGLSTDKITPADYDGDGKTDIGVFRPSNGTWYLLRSQQGSTATQFGQAGDVPVPADYDNDGRADIAVFRPSNGTWYLLGSTAGFSAVQFGQQGDVPVAGDFDADGRADQVVFRPSNGTWYLQQSQAGYTAVQFGMNGDVPTAGDFDADGRHDIAVFRPSNGTWYRLNSSNNQVVAVQFGSAEDLPAPADFDGDGRTDIAVFRPSNGSWYLLQSQSGFSAVQFGASGDRPAPSAQQP